MVWWYFCVVWFVSLTLATSSLPGSVKLLGIEEDNLVLSEEGLAVLRNTSVKVAFVSAVGGYRTGKSFLLNKLLGLTTPYEGGFGVGHGLETYTRGVWMHAHPTHISVSGVPVQVMWLDTEGMFSSDTNLQYGHKIFAFSLLFSSVLLVNNDRTFNTFVFDFFNEQDTISRIVKTELEHYGLNVQNLLTKPTVLWLLSRSQLAGDADEALEKFLAEVPNPNSFEVISRANLMRESIRNHFRNQAMAVPSAQNNIELWNMLPTLPDDQLNTAFLEAVRELRGAVFNQLHNIDDESFHLGQELPHFLQLYVDVINDKKFAANPLAVYQESILSNLCSQFQSLCSHLMSSSLPLSASSLGEEKESAVSSVRSEAEQKIRRVGLQSSDILDNLNKCIDTAWLELEQKNAQLLKAKFLAMISDLGSNSRGCLVTSQMVWLKGNFSALYPVLSVAVLHSKEVEEHVQYTRRMVIRGCFRLSSTLIYLLPYCAPLLLFSLYTAGLAQTTFAVVAVILAFFYLDRTGALSELLDHELTDHVTVFILKFEGTPMVDVFFWGVIVAIYFPLLWYVWRVRQARKRQHVLMESAVDAPEKLRSVLLRLKEQQRFIEDMYNTLHNQLQNLERKVELINRKLDKGHLAN